LTDHSQVAPSLSWLDKTAYMAGFFLLARMILFVTLPLEGLRGYGDFVHFFRLAEMGLPFFDIWVEFPPVFPFLSRLLYLVSGGQEHVYDYLLVIVLSTFQAGNILIFARLVKKLGLVRIGNSRMWAYFILLLVVAYGWWYFDPLAVFGLLLGIYWSMEGQDVRAGLALGFGILTKWFPALALAGLWRFRPTKKATLTTLISLGLTLVVYGSLLVASPQMTRASIVSQSAKGSWETVWALLDGNLGTGNFGPESERVDPSIATLPRGNPATIGPWITLIPFALIGLWYFGIVEMVSRKDFLAFLGVAMGLFFLWLPGWSPQWVLFLLPVVLLTLPSREGILMAIILVMLNLLEWPVLLSRGLEWGLWMTVPMRTLLLTMLVYLFSKGIPKKSLFSFLK
jgi:hypothetical protein